MPLSHQSNMDRLLYEAVRTRNTEGVSSALRNGANASLIVIIVRPSRRFFSAQPYSMLQLACDTPVDFGTIQELVAHGADLEAGQGNWEGPPLFLYFVQNYQQVDINIVRFLLQSRANPNGANHRGTTALHSTACAGRLDCVRLLLEYGADVEAENTLNWRPLHYACTDAPQTFQVVQEMVNQRGANIFARNHNHQTPLDVAVFCMRELSAPNRDERVGAFRDAIEILLRKGSDILFEQEGRLFLHSLIREQKSFIQPDSVVLPVGEPDHEQGIPALDSLVARDPTALRCRDEQHGCLPVHLACQIGVNAATTAFLVQWDADTLFMRDATGAANLPIHIAANHQHSSRLDVLKVLVHHGGAAAMLGARNAQGLQPLHLLLLSIHQDTTGDDDGDDEADDDNNEDMTDDDDEGEGEEMNDDDDDDADEDEDVNDDDDDDAGDGGGVSTLLETVKYMMLSHPPCVSTPTPTGDLPVTLAASSGASLDMIFSLMHGDPTVVSV